MASLDSVSIAIFLGAVLVMAGILSSLLALRFGAPLLLVFLFIGMLAGDAGPGQLSFDDVRSTYLVGSVALALILCRGGVPARSHAGPASAPACRSNPGSRIRHQRPVRDLSHPDAG